MCELLIDAWQRLVRGFMRKYINGCLRARPAAGVICANASKIQHFGAAHVDVVKYNSSEAQPPSSQHQTTHQSSFRSASSV